MKKKSHARASDKKGFSVALPVTLLDEINRIAACETRSRNKQIEKFLQDAVTEFRQSKRSEDCKDMHPPSQRSA